MEGDQNIALAGVFSRQGKTPWVQTLFGEQRDSAGPQTSWASIRNCANEGQCDPGLYSGLPKMGQRKPAGIWILWAASSMMIRRSSSTVTATIVDVVNGGFGQKAALRSVRCGWRRHFTSRRKIRRKESINFGIETNKHRI